jgi:hypothetical protein
MSVNMEFLLTLFIAAEYLAVPLTDSAAAILKTVISFREIHTRL